jgi:hypothetical protein
MSEPLTVDRVIAGYMRLRAQKEAAEAELKASLATINERMQKMEAWLMQQADAQGVTSFKTPHGTAFLSTTDFANVADWDAVLKFIRENDAFDMLERRVSKSAVRAHIDETKQVPPGVNYGTRISVNVRKPAAGSNDNA